MALPLAITAGASVLGGVLGGRSTKKAADEAAAASRYATDKTIATQEANLARTRRDLSPYLGLGGEAVNQLTPLLGAQVGNPAFDAAAQGVGGYSSNPLLQRAFDQRLGSGGVDQNALFQSAVDRQQNYDSSQTFNPSILNDPLLVSLQDEAQRRIFANQAARGRLGSGSTASALQSELVPIALQYAQQKDALARQDIADRASLGTQQLGLQSQGIDQLEASGLNASNLGRQDYLDRLNLGLSYEDLKQRQIGNLFSGIQTGQNSAALAGTAGLGAANAIGGALSQNAQAQSDAAYNRALGQNQIYGSVLGGFNKFAGQF